MPDEIDRITEHQMLIEEAGVAQIRRLAQIAPGEPGQCRDCGSDSPRLVVGRCAPCRDEIAGRK